MEQFSVRLEMPFTDMTDMKQENPSLPEQNKKNKK